MDHLKNRNKVVFEGKNADTENLVEEIKGRLWSWLVVRTSSYCNVNYKDWLENPRHVLDC